MATKVHRVQLELLELTVRGVHQGHMDKRENGGMLVHPVTREHQVRQEKGEYRETVDCPVRSVNMDPQEKAGRWDYEA